VGGVPVPVDAPTPASEVFRTGRAIWLESPADIAQRYPHLEEERARREEGAWAVVPLLASGKPIGVLAAVFPDARRLEPDDRTFVRLVAQPCAQALERARIFEQAAATRAEAERSAALLGALCGAAPLGLALLDHDMRFVHVNAAFARLNGLAPEGHVGRTPGEVLPAPVAAQVAEAFRAVVAAGAPVERALEAEGAAGAPPRRLAASWFPVRVGRDVAGVAVAVRER
jgi:GAF domain-containing protein